MVTKRATFKGGIHPAYNKHYTESLNIEDMAPVKQVVIPMACLLYTSLSNEVFDKEISKMLKEQCDYVKSVAQAAINSIDAMTAVCGMVFKETINGFPLSEK